VIVGNYDLAGHGARAYTPGRRAVSGFDQRLIPLWPVSTQDPVSLTRGFHDAP
jgi:hypothetical protein